MSLSAPVQVFGGCCLNVYSLEAFLGQSRGFNAGAVLSLAQLLSVCASAAYPMVDARQPRRLFLRRTHIPMAKLVMGAALFFTMSVLGNSIYSYGVSVPVQIAFRSSSVVFSMAVNAAFGNKRYSRVQVGSAVLMTSGSFLIISQHSLPVASVVSAMRSGHLGALRASGTSGTSAVGLGLLCVSSVLGAFLGLYTESVFAAHGRHWQEVLFYNHFLSIPLLVLTSGADLHRGLSLVFSSPPVKSCVSTFCVAVPRSASLLAVNAVTQVFCARGVNHLSSVASSVTVAVVLLVRKFASLVISACVFGTPFNAQGLVGSGLLIAGTLLYAQCQTQKAQKQVKSKDKP